MQQQMQVVCPEGCSSGDLIAITTPEGQQLQVQIPPGVTIGTPFLVNAPPGVPEYSTPSPEAPADESRAAAAVAAKNIRTKKLLVSNTPPASPEEKEKPWGDGCCITRAACKARLSDDMAEAGNPVEKCCAVKSYYESFLIVLASLFTVLLIIVQYGIVQRVQLTEGIPFPMFMEGTCTCTGADGGVELCPNVLFTLNLTDVDDEPPWAPGHHCKPWYEESVDTSGRCRGAGCFNSRDCWFGYWEAWRMTNEYAKSADFNATTAPVEAPSDGPSADTACRDMENDCCANVREGEEALCAEGFTPSTQPHSEDTCPNFTCERCEGDSCYWEFRYCEQDKDKQITDRYPLKCRGNLADYQMLMLPLEVSLSAPENSSSVPHSKD